MVELDLTEKNQILILLLAIVPEAVLESTLIPLYPFLVRHLLPNIPENTVGYHVGLIGSAFYLPLFFMNLVWGATSDHIGRKPVLLMGLVACLLTTIAIGTASSYNVALACRFIAGLFGGMIGDIASSQKSRAWAFAMYGSVYGVTGILGPALGGLLSNPNVLYPKYFSNDGIFGRYPYLLTCILGALLCFVAIYTTIFHLKENRRSKYNLVLDEDESGVFPEIQLEEISVVRTASDDSYQRGRPIEKDHLRVRRSSGSRKDIRESLADNENQPFEFKSHPVPYPIPVFAENADKSEIPPFSFTSINTIGPVFMYCIIAFVNMSYFTSLPLFFSAKLKGGGLELDSRDTSFLLTVGAGVKLLTQLFVFQNLLHYLGSSVKTFRMGMLLYIPAHILVPLLVYTPKPFSFISEISLMAVFGFAESLSFMSVIMLITERAQQTHLGMAHGFAATMAAFARTISPGLTGSLWELGVAIRWTGLVFIIGSIFSTLGVIITFLLDYLI